MTYNGTAWRSRFLRSPKIGIELAEREDFVPLGTVATISLGMKTGDDKFFFLERISGPSSNKVRVRGLKNYEFTISLDDLLPVLKNPNQLRTSGGRHVEVPTAYGRYSGDWYYFAPRQRLSSVVKEYIKWGELQGVDKKRLVQSNASGDWFRQTRKRVASPWVLPYNSGYSYEAVANSIGAVLNGRFVGVEPYEGIDSELLGALLNSTPVTVGRLLEGVNTGNEGAFDVGPPAARLMKIPDPRHISGAKAERILRAFQSIRQARVLPEAPDRDGQTNQMRRELDTAVLTGLEMTEGEATVLVDRIYTSYGRWRAAVEDVEVQMQQNRRALQRRGGGRDEPPAQRASRRIWDEISQSTPPLLNRLTQSEYEVVDPLISESDDVQDKLFDATTVGTVEGQALDLKDHHRIRLVRTVRELDFKGPLPLPTSADEALAARDEILQLQATVRQEIERRASKEVSADLVPDVVVGVEKSWLNRSFADVREKISQHGQTDDSDPGLFGAHRLVP